VDYSHLQPERLHQPPASHTLQDTAIVWFDLASAPLQYDMNNAEVMCSLRAPTPAALARIISSCGRCLVVASPTVFVRYDPQGCSVPSASIDDSEIDVFPLDCLSIVPSFFHRTWCVNFFKTPNQNLLQSFVIVLTAVPIRCVYALHTALVQQLPIDVAVPSQACRVLCDLLVDGVEGQLCELQEFNALASESSRHAASARILSHYEETCGFGDVSRICRAFWLKDVIARLHLQLQHSKIDIEDATAAANEAQQQADGGSTEVLMSGVASLMWKHLRVCMVVGHMLIAANRLAEAEDKFRFCYVKRRGVVGATHPDTLKSQHALAETLFLEEKFSEAALLAKDCSSLRRATLGSHHTDSLHSAYDALILQASYF
jgi:hypothetical protein